MRKRSNRTKDKDVPQDPEERARLLESLLEEEFGNAAASAARLARVDAAIAAARRKPLRPDHLDAMPATTKHQIN